VIYRDSAGCSHDVRIESADGDALCVVLGDARTELRVRDLGDGSFRLSDGEASWRVWVDRDGAARHVTVQGVGQAVLEKEGKGRRRRREAPQGTHASMMPGTVVKVLVKEGDRVAKGDDLVIVEAMKMEIKLSAQVAGTVRSVRAREGAPCDAGETLVELDAAEGAEGAEEDAEAAS
jgi:biotin carboxyl carrier protein